MRRQFLGALLFAGTLAFTACQNETIIYVDENGNPIENVLGADEILISITNTSENSRAARPVGSSAAANNVNKVSIKVYKDGEDVTSKVLPEGASEMDWKAGPTEEGEPITDREGSQVLKLNDLEANATYRIVAYGYNETAGYKITENASSAFTASASEANLADYALPELFAGELTITTDDSKKISSTEKKEVLLERQVAGMIGYFENVPVCLLNTEAEPTKVKYVRVYANAETIGFKFSSVANDLNGTDSNDTPDKTESGMNKYLLMEFDMSSIASDYETIQANLENLGIVYTMKTAVADRLAKGYTDPGSLALKAGSMFGGRYILPYSAHVRSQTITIELQDESNKALKTLNVNTTAEAISGYSSDATISQYDIRRNNFYSIGKKYKTGSTEGPDEGNTDDDKPIDLSTSNEIIVTINDAWDVLHDMTVTED